MNSRNPQEIYRAKFAGIIRELNELFLKRDRVEPAEEDAAAAACEKARRLAAIYGLESVFEPECRESFPASEELPVVLTGSRSLLESETAGDEKKVIENEIAGSSGDEIKPEVHGVLFSPEEFLMDVGRDFREAIDGLGLKSRPLSPPPEILFPAEYRKPEALSAPGGVERRASRKTDGGKTPDRKMDGDLAGVDLSGTNLEKADFSNRSLEDTNFTGCDMRYSVFRGATLKGTNFTAARLAHADFSNLEIEMVRFTQADLSEANFENSKLHYCDFRGADLRGANFRGTSFPQSMMDGGTLTEGADFRNSDFSGLYADGTDFTKARLR